MEFDDFESRYLNTINGFYKVLEESTRGLSEEKKLNFREAMAALFIVFLWKASRVEWEEYLKYTIEAMRMFHEKIDKEILEGSI